MMSEDKRVCLEMIDAALRTTLDQEAVDVLAKLSQADLMTLARHFGVAVDKAMHDAEDAVYQEMAEEEP